MATERHPKHGEEGYEHADANVRSLYQFGAVLAILIIAVMWAMVHTYNFFAKHESLGPPASPFENQRELPPQPRLQPHPATDLKRYCEIEQEQLSTYGWVDKNNGLVRIPVDRAMEIVLQKGLPARPANQVNQAPMHYDGVADGIRRYTADDTTAVPASSEPPVMGISGPCGYLVQPTSESGESKQRKD
jgi:hypothetical protein